MPTDTTLDLRGMKCPITTMRLKKALKKAASGDTLLVLTDDESSGVDFRGLCSKTGDTIAGVQNNSSHETFNIVKT